MVHLGNSWDALLADQFAASYYRELREFLKAEYRARVIYPPMGDIFNALKATPYEKVKVVILGQDPYHGPNQAHGMCFSVQKGVEPPPSLKNIFKELERELGITPPNHGYLQKWAEEGVLLLNTVLTVRAGAAASHRGMGWEQLTDRIIELLNDRPDPMVFMLWGSHARAKKSLLTNPNHLVLECAHPSPLSAYNGFFGCDHFKRANEFLKEPIDWDLKE
ncbi:MAG: uracil-DNA glycosylase [Clostridia bacterium]|nr:uracil-DNA glycosylase [Clostridia bacterium]